MGKVVTKSVSNNQGVVKSLVVRLCEPGMTPIFRAGLGGLAASLRARLLETDSAAVWPTSDNVKVEIPFCDGQAVVEATQITLHFGSSGAEPFLKELFVHAFRLRPPHQVIDLPGTYAPNHPIGLALLVAGQDALTRTFLQHGKTRKAAGGPKPIVTELDDRIERVLVQPFTWYVHQRTWADLLSALDGQPVPLSGWAHPGAILRHDKFKQTGFLFTAAQVLCGCFALVGCVSFQGTRNSGILVIPEPDQLLHFAVTRQLLSPRKVADAFVTGVSDAVLLVEATLRMQAQELLSQQLGVRRVSGVLLRATPWAPQQKLRVRTIEPTSIDDEVLDQYSSIARELPSTLRIRKDTKEGEASFFPSLSELRAFVTDNMASGRRWFQGFSTAKTDDPKHPRFIHRFRNTNDDLGALWPDERKGLIQMSTYLSGTEQSLVRSIHIALRLRYGAIASECADNDRLRENRFSKEYDRLRISFAGAKTDAQVRAALTDLWSRAGRNIELQAHWHEILPLLRTEHWQLVRDLALLALASYSSQSAKENPVAVTDLPAQM